MPLVLGSRSSRCLLAVLALAAPIYVYLCARVYRAYAFAQSGTVQGLSRATQLEPGNGLYWRQLGDIRLYRENDPEAALGDFRRAVELNPRDADAWMSTAYALQFLSEPAAERDAISRALAAEPRRPEIIWQAANLHAILGDSDAVLADVCVLLADNRARAQAAAELAGRSIPEAGARPNCNLQETIR